MKRDSGGCESPAAGPASARWNPSLTSPFSPRPSSVVCSLVPRLALYCFSNLFIDLRNQITFVQPQKWPGVRKEAFTGNREAILDTDSEHSAERVFQNHLCQARHLKQACPMWKHKAQRSGGPPPRTRHLRVLKAAILPVSVSVSSSAWQQKRSASTSKKNLEGGNYVRWPTQ